MRGALDKAFRIALQLGIIPADAGSTTVGRAVLTCPKDHPRGCGEHVSAVALQLGLPGSSPRMRGARIRILSKPSLSGIIPADAGSTPDCEETAHDGQDHPRGCGEH